MNKRVTNLLFVIGLAEPASSSSSSHDILHPTSAGVMVACAFALCEDEYFVILFCIVLHCFVLVSIGLGGR